MDNALQQNKKDSSMFQAGAVQLWDVMYGPIAWDESEFVCKIWKDRGHGKPGKALDIGCGTGRYVVPLSKNGWQVTGVDSSSAMLNALSRKAAKHDVQAELIQSEFMEFKTSDRYDLAFAFFSLIYVLPDRAVLHFLRKTHEFLRPEGIFLVNFFNAYEFWDTKGWNSGMARLFKGGHLKVSYTNTPENKLWGITRTEDFRQFSHSAMGSAYDATIRPIRFHSPGSIRLFMRKAGFENITFYSGFTGKELGPEDTRSAIITVAAARAKDNQKN